MGWYENDQAPSTTKQSMFSGAQHTIACNASGTRAIAIGDIDNDGLPDVLAMIYSGDRLGWYRNTNATVKDALFTKGAEHLLDNKLNGIRDAILVDLDNDGMLDVATVSEGRCCLAVCCFSVQPQGPKLEMDGLVVVPRAGKLHQQPDRLLPEQRRWCVRHCRPSHPNSNERTRCSCGGHQRA